MMVRCSRILFMAAGLTALLTTASIGQTPIAFYDYVRGDLDWRTIETEHFDVHYHTDDESSVPWTATEVARQAENIYGPITDLYGHIPSGKTAIVIRDFEDYSNGAAYFFDNMIVIWAPALNSPLRGQHEWIKNVVTHEFTHIVQVQSTMKSSRQRPFVYFQLLDYEDVRRPDVLYGYPNVIVTYPIPSISNPAWFAEGTAQYQRDGYGYDTWDTHRDMLLRMRVLSGEILSLADMGGFYSHSSLERETVYNQGYAFTLYLANRFGEQILADISHELSRWKNYSVDRAMKAATGVSADTIYDDWVAGLVQHYESVSTAVGDTSQYDVISENGFFNFHPHISPDGNRIAFLSNGSSSEGSTHLFVQDYGSDSTRVSSLDVRIETGSTYMYTCSFGHRLVPAVTGDFGWSGDSKHIVYAKRRETPEGYLYSDLYMLNVETEKSERLTFDQRASEPSLNSDGELIVFVTQSDGTTNLSLLQTSDNSIESLTDFPAGTQTSEPVFLPGTQWVYFTKADDNGSGIYRIHVDTGTVEVVVDDGASDERSASISEDGKLLFSSDQTGIFNIYELDLDTGARRQLTNVLGGAFMPSASGEKFAYAHYGLTGYNIATGSLDEDIGNTAAVQVPAILSKTVQPLEVDDSPSIDDLENNRYRSDFTSFSFYPVIRLDQYVSRDRTRVGEQAVRRGRLETLGRNTKVGMYVNSREILDELSFLAGVLIGPGSRAADSFGDYVAPASLLKLERDVFVQFDYRKGIAFSDKRWSPQLSLELFNIRRNVEEGLSIEEFSCTACFPPDTTFADISYNLWELNLTGRSKINRYMLAELTYRYSPYRVTTERFFSAEFQQSIDESSSRYFIGKAVRAGLRSEVLGRHRNADVFQEGMKLQLEYEYEIGRLLDLFDVEDGILAPVYDNSNVQRFTVDAYVGRRLPGNPLGSMHGVGVRLRVSSILGREVDSFYNDYVGGLVGARGYPFYALGGNETFWAQVGYTLPVFPRIKRQIGFVYVDKVFLKAYMDLANAWSGPVPSFSSIKKDIGAELRVVTGSFYILPSAFFISGTYGIDEFQFQLDETFVTPGGDETVSYGKSFQVHAGLLFSFDL